MDFTLNPDHIIIAIQLFACTWLFTLPTWWQDLLAALYENFLETWKPRRVVQQFFDYFYEIISCHKCLTFWTIFAVTLNPIVALLAAWVAWSSSNLK